MKTSFFLFVSVKIFLCVVYTHTRSKTIKYSFRHSDVSLLCGSIEYVTRFQVIKLKLLCEILKNEKSLLDIQTKCDDIANEILNAAIDAE